MKKHMRLTTDEQWKCVDCDKDTLNSSSKDYYMVTDKLWDKYGVGERMLCMECMETRIGHKLTPEDISDCSINTCINEYTMNILKNGKN